MQTSKFLTHFASLCGILASGVTYIMGHPQIATALLAASTWASGLATTHPADKKNADD